MFVYSSSNPIFFSFIEKYSTFGAHCHCVVKKYNSFYFILLLIIFFKHLSLGGLIGQHCIVFLRCLAFTSFHWLCMVQIAIYYVSWPLLYVRWLQVLPKVVEQVINVSFLPQFPIAHPLHVDIPCQLPRSQDDVVKGFVSNNSLDLGGCGEDIAYP